LAEGGGFIEGVGCWWQREKEEETTLQVRKWIPTIGSK